MKKVVIVEGARTPFGSFGGHLRALNTTQLGTLAAREAIRRAQISPEVIDNVVFGNVIQTHTNAAYVARHIGLNVGVYEKVPALIVNRLCGSGLQAVVSAVQSMLLGESEVALVGGVENMSMSPRADFTSRSNAGKLGSLKLEDMLLATLTDEYIGEGMGITAENLAKKYAISREAQDDFSVLSHQRAADARQSGRLAEEMISVTTKKLKLEHDEHIREDTSQEKLSNLRPSFVERGTVTAGNSSGINDGAASLVLATEDYVLEHDILPMAEIISWGIAGVDPHYMGIGPVPASKRALDRAHLEIKDIDLFEVNEAFAAQYLAVEKVLGLDRKKTNVNGGAIALGHPVGASGTRILLTLAYELRKQGLRYGLATLCIGGGQGIAMIIENKHV
ncbi:acetyl-CoA acetyltransferase family protein [Pullulanibacillus pueri]|nr:thiolase family protein [Pullulanibacillus pueri]MBM7681641.1 acetyl-CoA acetyltransferase family protein [Pullulanibacillus pueri]